MSRSDLDDTACLDRTMSAIERRMPVLAARANAWATGDTGVLAQLPSVDAESDCLMALFDTAFVERQDVGDIPQRVEDTPGSTLRNRRSWRTRQASRCCRWTSCWRRTATWPHWPRAGTASTRPDRATRRLRQPPVPVSRAGASPGQRATTAWRMPATSSPASARRSSRLA